MRFVSQVLDAFRAVRDFPKAVSSRTMTRISVDGEEKFAAEMEVEWEVESKVSEDKSES